MGLHRFRSRRRRLVRPTLETLESRYAPAIFVVNSAGDDGAIDAAGDSDPEQDGNQITLRSALDAAGSGQNPGLDTIRFAVQQITVPRSLAIGSLVHVLGSEGDALPGVAITFTNSSHLSVGQGSAGSAAGSLLKGLAINNTGGTPQFGDLIDVAAPDVTIENCYIGTDLAGAALKGTFARALVLRSDNASVLGSVIAGDSRAPGTSGINQAIGIHILANGAVVRGNHIGIDAVGNAIIGIGTGISGFGTSLGGPNEADRNVFGGATVAGLDGGFTTMENNFFGVGLNGSTPLPNFVGVKGGGGTIRNNVFSGNTTDGLVMEIGGTVVSNRFGTGADGSSPVPNGGSGILLTGRPGLFSIGGTGAGEGNVIRHNKFDGIRLSNFDPVSGSRIVGNTISDNDGDGIALIDVLGSGDIGGLDPGAGNVITGNGGRGIAVSSEAFGSGSATILGNSIFGNGGLAIDYRDATGNFGFTPNDGFDEADGIQNHPVLTNIRTDTQTGKLVISGQLGTAVNDTSRYRVEFFDSPSVHPTGAGEGRKFLGAVNVVQISRTFTPFSISLDPVAVHFVTATATKIDNQDRVRGQTSELSVPVEPFRFVVNVTGDGVNLSPDPAVIDVDLNTPGLQISLRAAIEFTNANPGLDTIAFNIPGVGTTVPTIRVGSDGLAALPAIRDAVVIDAATQPGAGMVELRGRNAFDTEHGIEILTSGAGSTIRGLVINNFGGDGVRVGGGSDNVIEGNRIGTDAAGNAPVANGGNGVHLVNTSGNTVRGNTISGNALSGVLLEGLTTEDNDIFNNRIGTNVAGATAVANQEGVTILNGANENSIGVGNVISGNRASGVRIAGSATENFILGNRIGLTADGKDPLGNKLHGVFLEGASNNHVGGPLRDAGNIISGNGAVLGSGLQTVIVGDGVAITVGSTGNTVEGNFIGLNEAGDKAVPNSANGVRIAGGSGNFVGSVGGNVISGNGTKVEIFGPDPDADPDEEPGQVLLASFLEGVGVRVTGVGATGNLVNGNRIGTDADGLKDVPNRLSGVLLERGAARNTVGGSTPQPGIGAGNVISGNLRHGVEVTTAANFNNVQGNLIGLDANGAEKLPNGEVFEFGGTSVALAGHGVSLDGADDTLIGGPTSDLRNVISGNLKVGVSVKGAPDDKVSRTTIQANFIGTNRAGDLARSNGFALDPQVGLGNGIELTHAEDTLIGGLTLTPGQGPGNVISGNDANGVEINAGTARTERTRIQGNLIGTTADGTAPLRNELSGVTVRDDRATEIGGTSTGAGNVISGNQFAGVVLAGPLLTVVQGNLIGTDITGTLKAPNGSQGVEVFRSAVPDGTGPTLIGGSTEAARNVISGNGEHGVLLSEADDVVVAGNFIGTNKAGTAALGNTKSGVLYTSGGTPVVGGATPTPGTGLGNLISGNVEHGIAVDNAEGFNDFLTVLGNQIGGGPGSEEFGNSLDGINIRNASGTVIGGSDRPSRNLIVFNASDGIEIEEPVGVLSGSVKDTRIVGNVIARNTGHGIHLSNQSSQLTFIGDTRIEGNFIGTDQQRRVLGNGLDGVFIDEGSDTLIGGTGTGELAGLPNVIAFNRNGVRLDAGALFDSSNVSGTAILTNSIFENRERGIRADLEVSEFKVDLTEVIGDRSALLVRGKLTNPLNPGPKRVLVQFFGNGTLDDPDNGEGELFLGSTEVNFPDQAERTFQVVLPRRGVFVSAVATELDRPQAGSAQTFNFSGGVRIAAGTDANGNGVADEIEKLGPLPFDAGQQNLVSVPLAPAGAEQFDVAQFIVLQAAPGKRIRDVDLVSRVPPLPPGVQAIGGIGFAVSELTPGESIVVRLSIPTGSANRIAKLTSTGDFERNADGSIRFFDFDEVTQLGAKPIFDVNAAIIGFDIHLRDGDRGDLDEQANGIIIDPAVLVQLPTTNLALEMTAGPGVVGQDLVYTLTARNTSAVVAPDARLVDRLPAGVDFVSASDGGSFDPATRTVTFELGDVAAGAAVARTLVVRPLAAGQLVNEATVAVNQLTLDSDISDNTARQTTTVSEPPLPPPAAPVDAVPVAPSPPAVVPAGLRFAAPRALKATGLVVSFRRVTLSQAPTGARVTVRLSATAGKLQLRLRGLKVTGNNTRRLTLSGTQAAVNRGLRALTLLLPRRGTRAKVTLSARAGALSRTASIAVS